MVDVCEVDCRGGVGSVDVQCSSSSSRTSRAKPFAKSGAYTAVSSDFNFYLHVYNKVCYCYWYTVLGFDHSLEKCAHMGVMVRAGLETTALL